jgi:hypothetical protein
MILLNWQEELRRRFSAIAAIYVSSNLFCRGCRAPLGDWRTSIFRGGDQIAGIRTIGGEVSGVAAPGGDCDTQPG